MRTAFIDTLVELAETDERIFLLTADLGWTVVEKFAAKFKDRFLNVGVAEANMAGIATGLAQAGYVPFIYSIATSPRCAAMSRCATARCCTACRSALSASAAAMPMGTPVRRITLWKTCPSRARSRA